MAQEVASEQKRWAFNFPGKCVYRARVHVLFKWSPGDSLVIHWLGLGPFTAGAGVPGSIPD